MEESQEQVNLDDVSEFEDADPELIAEHIRKEDPEVFEAADGEIEKLVETKKLDSLYKSKKEKGSSSINTGIANKGRFFINYIRGALTKKKLKTAGRFVVNSFVRMPTAVRFAEVVEYSVNDEDNTISLKLQGPDDSGFESRDGPTQTKWFTFDLDKSDDLEQLEFIMGKAGVTEPSKLLDKSVPAGSEEEGFGRHERELKLFEVPKTPLETLKYNGLRATQRLRLSEPMTAGDNRSYVLNRNFYLLLTLMFFASSLFISHFLFLAQILLVTYGFVFLLSTLRGIYNVLTYEEGERNYVKEFIY